ncbi:MAG: HD domain-containing phosphohydrolase [Granulosicoccus sp.]
MKEHRCRAPVGESPQEMARGYSVRHLFDPFGRLRLRLPAAGRAARSYSLRFSIGFLFTALITLLGAGLIVHNYERHRSLALDDAGELFSEVARNTAATASALYSPVESFIEQTARVDMGDSSINKLPLALDYFAESLASNNQIDSIYLGFDNGDFFLVRNVFNDEESRRALAAPDEASYIVQRIERGGLEQPLHLTTYYDADLRELELNSNFITGYDPRSRHWYRQAMKASGTIATEFYRFYTTGDIGTTLARRMRGGHVVIGADMRLETISSRLGSPSLNDSARIVLFTESGDIVGYNDADWLKLRTREAVLGKLRSPLVSDIEEPEIRVLFDRFVSGETEGQMSIDVGNGPWFASIAPIDIGVNKIHEVYAAILTPESELLSGQSTVRLQSILISLLALALAIALAWWLSVSISRSTEALALEARRIQRLKLDGPVTVRSRVSEIDGLANTIATMKSALQRFVALTNATLGELDVDALGELAIEHIAPACGATSATVLLLSDDKSRLVRVKQRHIERNHAYGIAQADDYISDVIELPAAVTSEIKLCPDQYAALNRERVWIEDISESHTYDTRAYRSHSVLVLPLLSRNGELVGVIHLGDIRPRNTQALAANTWLFAESLAAHAGLAFENQRLAEGRRNSFEALIRLVAQAIDAKSPHTGKHCQRVPILCTLLAEAASESQLSVFRDYSLTDAAREEFEVASWLHDCGKVATPDHIIDKATKLETVHNRIHDIRTRFEVLWRDAEIKYLRTLLVEPGVDRIAAESRRDQTQAALIDDFAFIARCNLGTDSMDGNDIERIRTLGKRTWTRHFNDKLGLSAAELARYPSTQDELPVRETLLADKPFQRIEREHKLTPWGDNPYEFDMTVPANEIDDGEIHNLTIPRGTLNEEERFRVNDHVVQTIQMLEAIPFPRELARVPRIAGNHHERLDGSGYPRRRSADELGIEDRILAIADVFEALTAADRPYRAARTVEASLAIMRGMCDAGQLCPNLFDLFVEHRLHQTYAQITGRHLVSELDRRTGVENALHNDDTQGELHNDID